MNTKCLICNDESVSGIRKYCSPKCQRKKKAIESKNRRDKTKALKPIPNCLSCQKPIPDGQLKYCSKQCLYKYKYKKNIGNGYKFQKIRGKNKKLKLIDMLGGSCNVCGYNKNYSCLAFHHKDPSIKKFGIDSRNCSRFTWEVLLEEASKCSVLCMNCHGELHNPQFSKEKMQGGK